MILERSLYLTVKKNQNSTKLMETLQEKEFEYGLELKNIVKETKTQKEYSYLVEKYGVELVDWCVENGVLVTSDKKWDLNNIEVVEIEISTHCNWRCNYCPVSIDPKKPKYMSMDIFNEIIEKAKRTGTVKYVTFNSYNEPTLDRNFRERLQIISDSDLKLRLHTNGSGLSNEIMDYMKQEDVLEYICFNLPSLDRERFEKMTGRGNYDRTVSKVDYAVEIGLPVIFSIQGTGEQVEENLVGIKERYQHLVEQKIEPWGTVDRAGLLQNEYHQNITIKGRLFPGCHAVINWIFINVDGDLFLCSEDYYQKTKYASITDGEIFEIINSNVTKDLRKQVCGGKDAPDNFICRNCNIMLRNQLWSRHL